jgi:hypothetical protein
VVAGDEAFPGGLFALFALFALGALDALFALGAFKGVFNEA